MHEKKWFKPKAFTHFTKKVCQQDETWINNYVSDCGKVKEHKFFPLLHKTIVVKRFKKSVDWKGNSVKKHYTFKKGKRVSNSKYREVYYPNHIDAHIYSYYAQKVIGPIYEAELKKNNVLNQSILAYRRIEIEGQLRCKCNIDFANEVFEQIKKTVGQTAVLALDISKFFDSLDHKMLKKCWAKLFNRSDLSNDHYSIFKSLTNFSYVEVSDIIKEFGYKHPNQIIQKGVSCFFNNGEEFRSRVVSKGYIKRNPFRRLDIKEDSKVNKVKVGIPQGTPLSALLANLYLLEFDKKVLEILHDSSGIYRRYSDDILVVCPKEIHRVIELQLYELIKDYGLSIQSQKTQKSFFVDGKLEKGERPVCYLGFQFDGNKKLIKSASIAKLYQKMKSSVRYRAFRASLAKEKLRKKMPVNAFLHRKKLYAQYSFLGSKNKSFKKRNFFSYANFASEIMGSPHIKKQLSKAWGVLHQEITKQEKIYKLPKIKKRKGI